MTEADAGAWLGTQLGSQTVSYAERDAILYALAVGVQASELDLVFERELRVLPTFALTLAQWAPDALGALGAFDTSTAVHGAQELRVLRPLPGAGALTMSASVSAVWDKGSAAVFDVEVESEYFLATWSIFAPGAGGFGGRRGAVRPAEPEGEPSHATQVHTFPTQAALYRLTGDHHPIHIDPVAAAHIGQPRPIMHGLCTLAASVLQLAASCDAHPAELIELSGRFAAPAFPGEDLTLQAWRGEHDAKAVRFGVVAEERNVIAGGSARFGA